MNSETDTSLIKRLIDEDISYIVDKFRVIFCEGGYTYVPHKHDHIEINYVKQGSCKMSIGGEEVTFNEEDCMILFPGVNHYFYIPQGKNCLLIQLEFQISKYNFLNNFPNLKDNFVFFYELINHSHEYFKIPNDKKISQTMARISDELKSKEDGYKPLVKLYFSELFILLSRSIKNRKKIIEEKRTNKFINKAIELINNNYTKVLTVERIANECGISSRHLRQLFHKHFGVNPSEYICSLRIQKAKELMHDLSLSLTGIAHRSGFTTQQYFCKVFKENSGLSPKKYRSNLFRIS